MMATKQTASLRDRRLSPSTSPLHHSSVSQLTRPNLKASLANGVHTSLPAKKAVPNYLKPKTAPSSDPSPRRSSTAISTATSSATGKTPSARKTAEKAQLPSSATAFQRSLKPSSPVPKPSSSSRLNGEKAIQTVTRSERTFPTSKEKNASSAPVKKKEASAIVAVPSPQVKLSSDHEAVIDIESQGQEQWQSDCEKVIKSLNELNNEEEIKFINSLIEEENQREENKGGELEHIEDVLESHLFDGIPKQPVVSEEIPKKVGVLPAEETLEERADVQKVEAVAKRVEPEARKPRLGAVVASVVAAMPAAKKKDAPRSNDVIEETKSKLMGSRRNRVLALVGAFETVISLQEPEGQPTQKAPQVQHLLQVQQVEQSLENQTDKLCVMSHEKQGAQEAQDSHQQGGDKVHEDQQSPGNEKHQVNGYEEEDVLVKEGETNEPLENVKEDMRKVDKAFEIRQVEDDTIVKEEEADKALQDSKGVDEELTETM